MTVTASIKFTQGMTTAPAGQALIGVTGAVVSCSNASDFNAISWEWELLAKPNASALTLGILAFGAVPSANFTPDVSGWYLIQLSVFDSAGKRAIDKRVFAVPETSGRHIPCASADRGSANFAGSTLGWDPYLEAWLKFVDSLGSQRVTTAISRLSLSTDQIVDVTASGTTQTLESNPATSRRVRFLLPATNVGTTFNGNGKNINGSSTQLITPAYATVDLEYNGTEWRLV